MIETKIGELDGMYVKADEPWTVRTVPVVKSTFH